MKVINHVCLLIINWLVYDIRKWMNSPRQMQIDKSNLTCIFMRRTIPTWHMLNYSSSCMHLKTMDNFSNSRRWLFSGNSLLCIYEVYLIKQKHLRDNCSILIFFFFLFPLFSSSFLSNSKLPGWQTEFYLSGPLPRMGLSPSPQPSISAYTRDPFPEW